MGLGVFTPALIIIGGLCGLALLISALNFFALHGLKSRMVTLNQQELFGERLLKAFDEKLTATSVTHRASIDILTEEYRKHVTEIAEVRASHNATVRTFDQMMASYNRLNQLLVERLLDMATGRPPAPTSEILAST